MIQQTCSHLCSHTLWISHDITVKTGSSVCHLTPQFHQHEASLELWLTSRLFICEWTRWWSVLWPWGKNSKTLTSGSRLMLVGSPLDTHGCDWCMLGRHAQGINTSRLTAAFTFSDLLHHLPTPPWITVTNVAIRVPCLALFSNQNTKMRKNPRGCFKHNYYKIQIMTDSSSSHLLWNHTNMICSLEKKKKFHKEKSMWWRISFTL